MYFISSVAYASLSKGVLQSEWMYSTGASSESSSFFLSTGIKYFRSGTFIEGV
jgi:hypothetical protein